MAELRAWVSQQTTRDRPRAAEVPPAPIQPIEPISSIDANNNTNGNGAAEKQKQNNTENDDTLSHDSFDEHTPGKEAAVATPPALGATADGDPKLFAPPCGTLNINSFRQDKVQALLATSLPGIMCLQETRAAHPGMVQPLRNAGWALHTYIRHDAAQDHRGGVALMIRAADYDVAPLAAPPAAIATNAEVVIARLTHRASGRTCVFASIYMPPHENVDVDATLSALRDAGVQAIGGDFNARHPRFCPKGEQRAVNIPRGTAIINWIDANGWSGSFDGLLAPVATTSDGTAVDFFLFAPDWPIRSHTTLDRIPDKRRHLLVLVDHAQPEPGHRRRVRPILWHLVTQEHLDRAQAIIATSSNDMVDLHRRTVAAAASLPHGPWQPTNRNLPNPFAIASGNPKEAWRLLQAFTPKETYHGALHHNGAVYNTATSQANALMEHFLASHSPPAIDTFPAAPPPPAEGEVIPPVCKWEMVRAFRRCAKKLNSAQDADGLGARFLHTMLDALCLKMCRALDGVFRGGAMPDAWKKATWVAVPKAGKPLDQLSSYRSVAITSCDGRLSEDVVCARILAHVKDQLHSAQYGFLPGRSIVDALGEVLGPVMEGFRTQQHFAFEERGKINWNRTRYPDGYLIAADLTNAFPRTAHGDIIVALYRLRAPLYLIRFVWRWLRPRTARVFHRGARSQICHVHCGVPQGSKMGPLLFLIVMDSLLVRLATGVPTVWPGPLAAAPYIRDVLWKMACYADDLTILIRSVHFAYVQALAKAIGQLLEEWGDAHNMVLSAKTSLLYVTAARRQNAAHDNDHIEFGRLQLRFDNQSMRVLGITVDRNALFTEHFRLLLATIRKREQHLAAVARNFHPRVAMTIARNFVETLLLGTELFHTRITGEIWKELEQIWARLVKLACGMVMTCANIDALLAAGQPSVKEMVVLRELREAMRRYADPRGSPLLTCTTVARPGTPLRLFTQLQRPPHPRAEGVGIRIRLRDPAPKDEAQRLDHNRAVQQFVRDRFRNQGVPWIEVWTDASCDDDHAAGAYQLYDSRLPLDAPPFKTGYTHFPAGTCSFAAECGTIEAALDCARELAPTLNLDPNTCVLLFSDSLSSLSMMKARMLEYHALAAPVAIAAVAAATTFRGVLLVHAYAHCNDPRGDPVDTAAGAAARRFAEALPPPGDPNAPRIFDLWHVDAARLAARPAVAAINQQLRNEASTFFKDTQARINPHAPTLFTMPGSDMGRIHARYLLQLRTGFCPVLPQSTYIRGLPAQRCPHCNEAVLSATHSGAVWHLFNCPQCPGPPIADLASNSPATAEQLIEHMRKFRPAAA